MPRARTEQATPDRLAAVLDELDAARRRPGWVPTPESLLDSRRPALQSNDPSISRAARHTRAAASIGGSHRGADGTSVRPHAPLLRVPASLRDAQIAPSRLAALGAMVIVLVAGLVLGGRVVLARASATPKPMAAASTAGASARGAYGAKTAAGVSGPTGFSTPTPAASASSATQVVVQVVGQVRRPGVVTLRAGSRVQDAVAAAGGALPSADLSAVNLARVISDGEQIQVPKPGQSMVPPAGSGAGTGGSSPPAGAASGTPSAAIINLNTADATGLDALPGVGPVLASRIVAWRTQNGRFNTVDELGEVSGIGDKLLARLRPLVSV